MVGPRSVTRPSAAQLSPGKQPEQPQRMGRRDQGDFGQLIAGVSVLDDSRVDLQQRGEIPQCTRLVARALRLPQLVAEHLCISLGVSENLFPERQDVPTGHDHLVAAADRSQDPPAGLAERRYYLAIGRAADLVRSGSRPGVLVVGAETLSRITDWSDRSTAVIFADGAGAVVLQPAVEPGILSTHLHADGAYKDMLYCATGVSKGFPDHKPHMTISMVGSEVFKVAVTNLGKAVEEALSAQGIDKSELDWLVPHQANIRIIQATARRLELPLERIIITVQDHGNTSAASVPLALDVGIRDGRIKRGELLLLEAFGGGFTWGSALIRY